MTPDREKLALKPCPFCGGGAHIQQDDTDDNVITIRCGECMFNYQRYHRTRLDQAVAAWNRRALLAETAPSAEPVASIVPSHCTTSELSFDPGILCVRNDGSGYIAIDEKDFSLEDDRCEGPDGAEGSVHWIVRLSADDMSGLRNFLNGVKPAYLAPTPSASEDRAGEDRLREIRERVEKVQDEPWRLECGALVVNAHLWLTPQYAGPRRDLGSIDRSLEFAANAPDDLRYLLSALTARDETIARLTRERDIAAIRTEAALIEAIQLRETQTAAEARLAVMGEALSKAVHRAAAIVDVEAYDAEESVKRFQEKGKHYKAREAAHAARVLRTAASKIRARAALEQEGRAG